MKKNDQTAHDQQCAEDVGFDLGEWRGEDGYGLYFDRVMNGEETVGVEFTIHNKENGIPYTESVSICGLPEMTTSRKDQAIFVLKEALAELESSK